jgi:hypothetical protein
VVAGNPATIRKLRVPPQFISPLLRFRWWRYAPWQLQHLDPSDIQGFLVGLQQMNDVEQFKPDVINLKEK